MKITFNTFDLKGDRPVDIQGIPTWLGLTEDTEKGMYHMTDLISLRFLYN